jgi:putative endonuclease
MKPLPPAVLGRKGERRAAWFYRLRGYWIVGRNVRLAAGEIDLIAKRFRTVVIAEVKTRQSMRAGEGFEAVDERKRERLVRIAEQYAAFHPHVQIRFDVLSLFWNGRRFEIRYFPDAFRHIGRHEFMI